MNAVSKLEKFFDKELKSGLSSIIITYKDGRCELFGKYLIEKQDGLYKTTVIKDKSCLDFLNLRNAVGYCTLLDAGKYNDSKRLYALDLKLSSLEVDTNIHKKLLRRASDPATKTILSTKLQNDSMRRKLVIQEISFFINNSKTLLASKLNRKL